MGDGLVALTYLVKGLQISTRQHDIQFRKGKNKDGEGEGGRSRKRTTTETALSRTFTHGNVVSPQE